MYKFDRVRKCKFVFCALTALFFVLSILGFGNGGYELIWGEVVFEEAPAIVMVVSLCFGIICLLTSLTINALEKDVAEWLKVVESKVKK